MDNLYDVDGGGHERGHLLL